MNIQSLSELLSRWDDITVIGRKYEAEGIVANIMGLVQYGEVCKLLILLYDEEYQRQFEMENEQVIRSPSAIPESNRLLLKKIQKSNPNNPFLTANKVYFDEKEIIIHYIEINRFDQNDMGNVLLLSEFLKRGWQPYGVESYQFDMLHLISVELEGSVPVKENQTIRFSTLPHSTGHLVEKPITIFIGTVYPDKLMFMDKVTGQEHWVQINSVYLIDLWEHLASLYNSSRMIEQMTPMQLNQAKITAEKRLLEVCPKEMYFPIVEYECDEDIFLDFYSRSFLDSKPLIGKGAMSFFIKPEQSVGKLGKKLNAAIIREPYPPDTTCIEIELFLYNEIIAGGNIVL